LAGACIGLAGDEAAELGFELGEAAVEEDLAGFEQVGDRGWAFGLAEGGGLDPQVWVGGVEDAMRPAAAWPRRAALPLGRRASILPPCQQE
jgi:hypothetical protein